jgi:hypothetical protein
MKSRSLREEPVSYIFSLTPLESAQETAQECTCPNLKQEEVAFTKS